MQLDTEDMLQILDHFSTLEDPRSHINRKHLLGDLMVICVGGVLAGCDGPIAIGRWAKLKKTWLEQHLELPGGIPSHDTIGRLLTIVRPAAFQACFANWLTAIIKTKEAALPQTDDAQSTASGATALPRHYAIDGKTLRRSHDRCRGLGALHLVSVWAVDQGVSLGQLATEAKSNEITAIPELLQQVELNGAVVTIDAMGCQKEIAATIVDRGGDFCLALKGNQGKLHAAVVDYAEAQIVNDFPDCQVEALEHQERKQHGRQDHYAYYQFAAPADLPGFDQWKNLKSIGVAIRRSQCGDKETVDVRFYILSLALNVAFFAKIVRGHWAIENTLHWCLDVTFREDDSRVRERNLTNNLAWLRRFAISLLKQMKDKQSVAMRRRSCGWSDEYFAQVLFGKEA